MSWSLVRMDKLEKKVNVEPRICAFERDLVRLTWFVVSEQFFTDTTLDTLP